MTKPWETANSNSGASALAGDNHRSEVKKAARPAVKEVAEYLKKPK